MKLNERKQNGFERDYVVNDDNYGEGKWSIDMRYKIKSILEFIVLCLFLMFISNFMDEKLRTVLNMGGTV